MDIWILHFTVVFGQFDRKDDAGDEEDQAPAKAEPEYILQGDRTQQEKEMERYSLEMFWCMKLVSGLVLTREFTTCEQKITATESTVPATGPHWPTCCVIWGITHGSKVRHVCRRICTNTGLWKPYRQVGPVSVLGEVTHLTVQKSSAFLRWEQRWVRRLDFCCPALHKKSWGISGMPSHASKWNSGKAL